MSPPTLPPRPVRALVPVKASGSGKSRLAPALSEAERSTLTRCMAEDVLGALRDCQAIESVVILGSGEPAASLARETGCRLLPDDASGDLCANLDRAAALLAGEGTATLLIVPADLPGLAAADLDTLLRAHDAGVTLAAAGRDGGTNALVLSPPQAIACQFGPDSAARHLAAGRAAGVPATRLSLQAFARDLDTVDDVRWFCRHAHRGATFDYLQRSGICARLAACRT